MKKLFWLLLILAALNPVLSCEAQPQRSFMQIYNGVQVWPIACPGCNWNKSFQPVVTLKQSWTVSSVIWSSDGRYLAVGSGFEGTFNIYDTDSWKLVFNIPRIEMGGRYSLLRFTDHNAALVLPRLVQYTTVPTTDDNVSLEKWGIKSSLVEQKYYVHIANENGQTLDSIRKASTAQAVAATSDGRLVAAAVATLPSDVLIYDGTNGNVTQDIQCQGNNLPQALAFSPDGQDIAMGGCYSYAISVHDIKTGRLKFQTAVDRGAYSYNPISYSQNGDLIAVGSSDGDHGSVTILNASDGSIVGVLPNSPPAPVSIGGENATITNLQWIDNNLILVSYDSWNADGSVARIWDTRSLSLVGEIAGNQMQIAALDPSGTRLAAVISKDVIIGNLK